MTRWRVGAALAAVTTTAALTSLAAPAMAQEAAVSDPAGDATNGGLDFVRVQVDNRDDKIVVRARFVEARPGDLIVSVDPRRKHGLRLVSDQRPGGETRSYVLPGAFTDRSAGASGAQCPGFRVSWSAEKDLARMVLPSTCLQDGNYGAIRFQFLSERGSDSDFGPETQDGELGTSRWIPRG